MRSYPINISDKIIDKQIYASFADTSRLDNSDISAAAAADDGKGSIKGSAEVIADINQLRRCCCI